MPADDVLRLEAVTGFDAYFVGVDHHIAARQFVYTGGAIARNFILDVSLRSDCGKGVVAHGLTPILALYAIQAAAVTRQFGDSEASVIVAEHRVELLAFQFYIQAAGGCCVKVRLGRVRIQRVILGRIDRLLEQWITGLFGGVISQGQKIVTPDAAFRIKSQLVAIEQLLVGFR